jgi:hypothetical protein
MKLQELRKIIREEIEKSNSYKRMKLSPYNFKIGDLFLRTDEEWEIKSIKYPGGDKRNDGDAVVSFTNGKTLPLSQTSLWSIKRPIAKK